MPGRLEHMVGAAPAGEGANLVDDVGGAGIDGMGRAERLGPLELGRADVVDQVRALTGGRGADHVFEAAGHPSAFRLSVEAVRPAGQVVWLGKINVNQDVSFRWGSLMGEKRIVRSSYGDALPKRDFPWLCSLWLDGKLELDALITRRIALDQINDGFAGLAQGVGIRTVIEFA